jgi:hypothetical protein
MSAHDDGRREDRWTLIEEYEQLRGVVLGRGVPMVSGRGLALLRRSGMAAWMQVADYVATESCGRRELQPLWQSQRPAEELVTILAQMTMAAGVPPARMEETRR